jgi:hypothetical protein
MNVEEMWKKPVKPETGQVIVTADNEIVISKSVLNKLKLGGRRNLNCQVQDTQLRLTDPGVKPVAAGTVKSWSRGAGSGGQVSVNDDGNLVISKDFARHLELSPEDAVEWTFDGETLVITKGNHRPVKVGTVRSWARS